MAEGPNDGALGLEERGPEEDDSHLQIIIIIIIIIIIQKIAGLHLLGHTPVSSLYRD